MSPADAAAEVLRRRLGRGSLVDFAQAIDVPGKPASDDPDEWMFEPVEEHTAAHHVLIMDKLEAVLDGTIKNLMIFAPPGSAKALALDTPIPTPTGWTTMGSLSVGDQVFDENGKPCNVTWKSPIWKDRPVYTVRTDCGDEIVADTDHEWRVCLDRKPRRVLKANGKGAPPREDRDDPASKFKIKETGELAAQHRSKRPLIERAKALQIPDVDLPVDPYLLGVWLGDGTSSTMAITSSLEDQPWLRAELLRLGYETRDRSVPTCFGVPGVRGLFVGMGLINDIHHSTYGRKHIPQQYMRASEAQRLSLLQGLVDTDGTVCKKRGCTTFCNTNLELAQQVRELVRSLGVKAGWSESPAMLNGKNCGSAYKVSFYLKGSARLPRKAELTRDQYRTPHTYVEFEAAPNCDTVCIEVDSPSHLFLCGQSMTPTHNSSYASVVFPAYAMGKRPGIRIILASYASDIAWKQSRRTRQIVRSAKYRPIFNSALQDGNQSVESWATDNGSEYMAGGLTSGLTGNRANLILIDDPVKGREDAESATMRKKTREAYEDDLKTRLIPGGGTVIIQCMTGDTVVLMADGTKRQLKDISSGAKIATYDNGILASASVLNWVNHGPDYVFRITTKSGIMVKANGRHPFLVYSESGATWKRLKDLKPGDQILRVTGESGEASDALRQTVLPQQKRSGCAPPTTTRSDGLKGFALLLLEKIRRLALARSSSIDTASPSTTTSVFSQIKAGFVRFASALLRKQKIHSTGTISCASITAISPTKYAGSCATTATLPSAEEKQPKFSKPLPDTCDFTPDEIFCIEPAGMEDVFDIQVERTENFIANGLVSHNTRWHEADLSGGILPENWDGESGLVRGRDGEDWYVLCLPAIADREDDPLGRKIGEPLWPGWFSEEHFEKFRGNPRTWAALFQQRPRPSEGAEFKMEWLQRYRKMPATLNKIILCDPSSGKNKDRGDYSCFWVVGLAPDGNAYIVDCVRDRLNLTGRINALFDLHRKWKPLQVRYEQYGLQADIEAVRSEQERQQYRFKITEVGGTIKKEDRIRRLIPWFQNGRIYIPEILQYRDETGVVHNLVDEFVKTEYVAFPVARHDDMMDALARIDEPGLTLPFPKESAPQARISGYIPSDSMAGPLG